MVSEFRIIFPKMVLRRARRSFGCIAGYFVKQSEKQQKPAQRLALARYFVPESQSHGANS
jgi:hypothetical protein